jgi:hypothetical protein
LPFHPRPSDGIGDFYFIEFVSHGIDAGATMKRAVFLFFLSGIIFLSAYLAYPFALRTMFLVSGTAEIVSDYAERAAKPNTMLFLVARNEEGVPVAVKKIINPVFPIEFQLTASNLILPDILTKKVYLEAIVNNHGELGVFRNGDLKSAVKRPVFIFSKKNLITIDTPAK